jgi:hypothetical protein
MRFLIMLEETETGFAVQAPDLARTPPHEVNTANQGRLRRLRAQAHDERKSRQASL